VKLTLRSDYAARAVLGLAWHFSGGEPKRVESLAAGLDLSSNIQATGLRPRLPPPPPQLLGDNRQWETELKRAYGHARAAPPA
jgi:hypothetical protein